MWCQIIFLFSVVAVVLTEMTAPGIDRSVGERVQSLGYKMVYGDEDLTVINEVVSDMEKKALKNKVNINEALPPMPIEDVKCLMSVNRYCSKEMGEIKSVLIQALREDCKHCTNDQKEKAGKIAATMMAHDPEAWKMFLTRSAIEYLPEKYPPVIDRFELKSIGEPEQVLASKYRYLQPGYNVRVKRYAAEIH